MNKDYDQKILEVDNNKRLVHLVLIKFKDQITSQQFQKLTDGAYNLQAIPVVEQLNFTDNISPEGILKNGNFVFLYKNSKLFKSKAEQI